MRTTALVLGLGLLSLALAPALHAADEDLATRIYDVGPLLRTDRPPDGVTLGIPDPDLDLRPLGDEDEEEPLGFLEPDALVDTVLAVVPAGWDEDDEVRLELEGRRLLVRASPAVHEAVARLLGDLWTEATRRIRVEGIHLRLGPEARKRLGEADLLEALATGRLDAAARSRLVAASASSSGAVSVRPGAWGSLGRTRSTAYVGDYAVEIAQDSIVGDPVVSTVTTGWFVDVTPHRLQDGDVYLDVLAQAAELEEPMRRQPLEVQPFGSVDLPTCRVLRFRTAARLGPGESLLVGSAPRRAHDPWELLVLTPSVVGGRAARPDLRRWDLSALTAMPAVWTLTRELPEVRGVVDAGAMNPPRFARLEPEEPIASVDSLLEAVATTLGDEIWERENVWFARAERSLMAHHEPAVLARVERLLADREAALVHEPAVVRLLAVSGERTDVLASASVALPHGRSVVWQAGVERAYVADWSVEVAQEARTGEPQVATVFGGLAFEARLDPAPVSDRFALTLDLLWADLDPHMETRRMHNECTGIVDVPRLARLDVHADLVVARGETQRFDAGTLEDGRRLVVEVALGTR